ncbi:DUF484 family protein [Caldichromatium japonicum]|uniref:DUF484 family protein n=1 Tax=Caldichromatium japonicum TaxID=2699430 RepID=A0A6G7VCR9_9GAMM|nr:DUF484 family protein [Caldichromatium japonicum]QIK37764.1 DUF484 family protein [Caldichromatium japonicum]
MSERAREDRADGAEDERQVAIYLIANPDFLVRHPEVLAVIDVPHRLPPGVCSLVEYQVQRLRRQLTAERKRLAHLIARAREYEAFVNRLHALTLKLLAIDQSEQLCHLLRETLMRTFRADAILLKLFPCQRPNTTISDPLAVSFRDFIDRRRALCGPLNGKQAQTLFGEAGSVIQSAAIIPLQTDEHWGVIAIGNTDPECFSPEMDTEIFDRLGELLSQKLRSLPFGQCEGHV